MNVEVANALAFTYLSRRERTTHEVREHLLARGADDQVATAVVRELADHGYLDDVRFARLFAQDKRDLNGWGTGRIRRALLERGVAGDVVTVALRDAEAADGAGPASEGRAMARSRELERALAVLQRRFPNLQDTGRERQRALGVLLRKGYEYELAVDALAGHLRQVGDAVARARPQY